jgi:mannose-1-phosphate guanylyltransferase
MKVKECLVLAAGHGTRMGELGKYIPKPLWPLFEREILFTQLSLLKKWGIEKVFVNSHHHADLMEEYIKFIKPQLLPLDIELLFEPELLDSGGGVMNCLKRMSDDVLLVINSDVFFVPKDLPFLLKPDPRVAGVMYAISVNKEDSYNRLVVDGRRLVDIVPATASAPQMTFSGVSLINKKNIIYVDGSSKFFNTVLNFKENLVVVEVCPDYEYLDLGTVNLYTKGVEKLLLQQGFPRLRAELDDLNILKQSKDRCYSVGSDCYWNYQLHTDRINISSEEINNGEKGICIGTFKADLDGSLLI